jgi:hypothetical protein
MIIMFIMPTVMVYGYVMPQPTLPITGQPIGFSLILV